MSSDFPEGILDIVLQDDETSTGGVSHDGETVGEFVATVNRGFENLEDLNKALKECGIKEIQKDW